MEMKSPPPCPPIVTVRRNPPRKARTTPASAIPLGQPLSTPSAIPPFPIEDILSDTVNNTRSNAPPAALAENLKVYLRIRPLTVQNNANAKRIAESKNAWPKNPKTKITSRSKVAKNNEVCVQVNDDLCSVTVSTPQSQQETKRLKSEVYEGFSRVFPSEASQSDVYEEMVKPLVEDFVNGKCGMLAAMGPSGSGKTHTVFGSGREPGMVPLALRGIFSNNRSSETELSRTYYFSMMEISSERGKGERIIDLLHDGGPIYMQQSVVKGIQEAVVCDAQQAESLIARGMLKRATATTNSNTKSSRSQCIINIRCASKNRDGGVDGKGGTTLTIVDLAGAEKEKKTGNQGARLLESNFINNTSMVFGLCLRSLLEHQKNRNKQLPKHYHNSLLTRYMREYLEGKKRMALILTVKPGIEDYPDTTFLLRQASPFANIKFKNVEEPVNLNCSKRPSETLPRLKQLKKMKFGDNKDAEIRHWKEEAEAKEQELAEAKEAARKEKTSREVAEAEADKLALALQTAEMEMSAKLRAEQNKSASLDEALRQIHQDLQRSIPTLRIEGARAFIHSPIFENMLVKETVKDTKAGQKITLGQLQHLGLLPAEFDPSGVLNLGLTETFEVPAEDEDEAERAPLEQNEFFELAEEDPEKSLSYDSFDRIVFRLLDGTAAKMKEGGVDPERRLRDPYEIAEGSKITGAEGGALEKTYSTTSEARGQI